MAKQYAVLGFLKNVILFQFCHGRAMLPHFPFIVGCKTHWGCIWDISHVALWQTICLYTPKPHGAPVKWPPYHKKRLASYIHAERKICLVHPLPNPHKYSCRKSSRDFQTEKTHPKTHKITTFSLQKISLNCNFRFSTVSLSSKCNCHSPSESIAIKNTSESYKGLDKAYCGGLNSSTIGLQVDCIPFKTSTFGNIYISQKFTCMVCVFSR